MSRICPLFSGSTGNSTYIAGPHGAFLVDAGVSLRSLTAALQRAGGELSDISALLITHEHIDHIKGLKPLLNKTHLTVIASEKTLEALVTADKLPAGTKTKVINSKTPLEYGGTLISRFATSHDCEGSSGYTFLMPDGKKISVCTDLGVVTDNVRNAIEGSDVILLESNHDVDMLNKGPYPPELKMRIMSEKGHISNNACSSELVGLLNTGTERFILGHLSQKNNTPLLALSTAEAVLADIGAKNGRDYILNVAAQAENRVTVV
ncbi:MAG: MBL fold metallo-hydrolase [Acutalibacteraceae bacterium]|nr:MBL fold metallo-hydrolase [Acutalibacteraceae bacterium]